MTDEQIKELTSRIERLEAQISVLSGTVHTLVLIIATQADTQKIQANTQEKQKEVLAEIVDLIKGE